MYSLVIIDMQYGFEAASIKGIQRSIFREVSKAINKNLQIVVVEYDVAKRTLLSIHKMLNGYDNKVFVKKFEDDGSCVINPVLKSKNVRVVGVNTNFCVQSTVEGLTKYFKKNVDIVCDACYTKQYSWDFQSSPPSYQTDHLVALKEMNKLKNVKLLFKNRRIKL